MATVTVSTHIQWNPGLVKKTALKRSVAKHASPLIGNKPPLKPSQAWISG